MYHYKDVLIFLQEKTEKRGQITYCNLSSQNRVEGRAQAFCSLDFIVSLGKHIIQNIRYL
jgi:hypothetical protein